MHHSHRYTILPTGAISPYKISAGISRSWTFHDSGVTLALQQEFEDLQWFGRGPTRSCSDRV